MVPRSAGAFLIDCKIPEGLNPPIEDLHTRPSQARQAPHPCVRHSNRKNGWCFARISTVTRASQQPRSFKIKGPRFGHLSSSSYTSILSSSLPSFQDFLPKHYILHLLLKTLIFNLHNAVHYHRHCPRFQHPRCCHAH